MIQFREKIFTEYDAMTAFYKELIRLTDRRKFGVVDSRSLLPILKGNNVVIERFVISTSTFGKSKYRMYLKVGAKAKMPDEVRLPDRCYDVRLLNATVNIGNGGGGGGDKNNQQKQKNNSETGEGEGRIKLFGNNSEVFTGKIGIPVDITYTVKKILGEAIKYDKAGRSLVLEFDDIQDAIRALNILPFGLNYKIYLLDL